MTLPLDFVVAGAQKAGSTHLGACLAGHPELYVCPDEVPYFEDPFYANSSPHELTRAMKPARPGQRLGIHRPEYLARPECPARIASDVPSVRVLTALRDPVARALAAYYWYVQFAMLPLLPADDGLARLLDGWTDDRYPHAGEILEFGRYGSHLQRYVDHLGTDRVLAVRSDDLDRPETYARVFDFLGVDTSYRPPEIGHRTNEGVYDLRRLRWLRLRARLAHSWDSADTYVYRRRRWRHPVRFVPTAFVVGVDRALLSRLVRTDRAPVPPDLERALRIWYADDLDILSSLVGWDVGPWKQATGTAGTAEITLSERRPTEPADRRASEA